MEVMDWGEVQPFVQFGEVGEDQVNEECAFYILVAPQNIVGSSILTSLSAMVSLPSLTLSIVALRRWKQLRKEGKL